MYRYTAVHDCLLCKQPVYRYTASPMFAHREPVRGVPVHDRPSLFALREPVYLYRYTAGVGFYRNLGTRQNCRRAKTTYWILIPTRDGGYGEIATQAEKGSPKSEKGSPKRGRIAYQIDPAVLGSRTKSLGSGRIC